MEITCLESNCFLHLFISVGRGCHVVSLVCLRGSEDNLWVSVLSFCHRGPGFELTASGLTEVLLPTHWLLGAIYEKNILGFRLA